MAVIGAGPAGIYAADILSKAGVDVSIDIIEHLPAPFGLVRYGVAPDHPRIKAIITALRKVLEKGQVRLLANVRFGTDLTLADIRRYYDAVIFATGTIEDAPMELPGQDLPGNFGAADFVSWFDGHPDVPRTWPLEAQHIAVLGAGNVALDVARMLAKHPKDLLTTEIPDNVYQGLAASPVTDVHVFARRGPAQAKFSPLELRELGHVPDVDVLVYPEDFEFDEGSQFAIDTHNQTKQVVKTLTDWAMVDPQSLSASRRIHLHFLQQPVEVVGEGQVQLLRTERTALLGDQSVAGTGQFHEWPVQAVYRAVGYFGSPLPDVPFDADRGVIPNAGGRVLSADGSQLPGMYTTGWIKRGPVGLIGSTKSDAQETVRHLLEDLLGDAVTSTDGADAGLDPAGAQSAGSPCAGLSPADAVDASPDAVLAYLQAQGVDVIQWEHFELVDIYERQCGEAQGRERIKLVPRQDMIDIALGQGGVPQP